MKTKKTLLTAVVLVLVFVLAFFRFFIAAGSDHDCSGEECRVCRMIAAAEKTLKELTLLILSSAVTVIAGAVSGAPRRAPAGEAFVFTPVLLKVKLTD